MGRQRSTSAVLKKNAARHGSRNPIGGSLIPLGLLIGILTVAALVPSTALAAECTNTWVGPTEGTWTTAANWSAGHIPTSADVACIGSGKKAKVTTGTNQVAIVQGEGTIAIAGGALELTTAPGEGISSIAALTVSSGTLAGIGQLNILGVFTWSGGMLSGPGTTILATGSTATSSGSNVLNEHTLVNNGAFTLSTKWIAMKNGAVIENNGTFNNNAEGVPSGLIREGEGAAPMVINVGTFRKTAGSGETIVEANFENRGTLSTSVGVLGFPRATGTATLASGSVVEGAVTFRGPAVTGENFHAANGTLRVTSGSFTIPVGYTAHATNLVFAATLSGSGTLEVSNNLSWTGGTMTGNGTTVVGPGATANSSGGNSLVERTLVNEGTFTLSTKWIAMKAGATIENIGAFVANTEGSGSGISRGVNDPTPRIINTGAFEKTIGTGPTVVKVEITNRGTIAVGAGNLSFTSGGVSTNGSWVASPGTTLTLSGGSFSFTGGGLSGAVTISQTTAVAESVETSNLSLLLGGSFESPGSLTLPKGTMHLASLTVAFQGTVTGDGDYEIAKSFALKSEGKIRGPGVITLQPGGVGSIESGTYGTNLYERTLINEGTMTFASSYLGMNDGARIINRGTFNANSESAVGITGKAPAKIINAGVFRKTSGTGTTKIDVSFENLGAIREEFGKLKFEHLIKVIRSEQFGKRCDCGDPIEAATGNFSENQTDFGIGGRGIGLVLTRSYSAQAAASGTASAFGYGWTSSFSDNLVVKESGANVTLAKGDGSTIPFTRVSGMTYSAPAWSQDTLSGSPEAGYIFTRSDQIKFSFSGSGRLEKVADRNGNETALSYDEAGRLKAITDPAGRQITFVFNAAGQIQSAEDPMGYVVKYAYEGGNLASVTMPGEASPSWQFKYDASHRMTSMTDGRGGKTTNEYDSSNRVISQTDGAGRTLTFKYEAFHTTITNKSTGAVTDEWFTSNNEPFSITRGYGTAIATTETFSYNEAGQLVSMTDGEGHTTTYGYDAEGNRTSKKDPAGDETKWTFNGTHDVVSMTTPLGETTTLTRDANGNVESISRPAPGEATQITTVGYNAYGEPETVTDPLNRSWLYSYDEYGDRTSETDPAGDTQTLAYDEDSRLISLVSPRGNVEGAEPAEYTTTIERDAQGRRRKVIDPLGHTIEYAYDADGNLVAKTDRNGHTTKYVYNADNEPIKIEEPNGDVMETGYDGAGQVTSQTNGNEHTTTYVRNVLEQPVEVIDPLGRKTTEEFDAAGNLKAVLDAAERKASYAYDAANRLVEVNYSEEATPDVKFGYDADGNVTSMLDGTGESSYSFDQLGRLTRSEDGHGDVVGYGYDLAEELTGITYPNGKSISRTFDPAGRLESVTDWLGGKTTFAYNADSGLEGIAFPAGSDNVDEFAYDRIDRMSEAKFTKGAETLASLSYGRDNAGQVVSDRSQGLPGPEELAYGYDANSRLTTAGEASYEYDASDNVTKAPGTTNTYDAGSQLEAGTGVLYSYDKLGNRIQETPSGGPATSYAYDQAGNLTSVKRPEEGEVPAIAESFAYNGNGLMTSRTNGLATDYMTWDCNAPLPQMLSDGENSYLYGPGGLPIEQISAEESPTYLHHDQLGSTRMLTSPSGEAVGAFTYGAYGQLEAQSGSASTPMGYAGQYTDGQSGLQYLRARFYDPSTAQFMTLDPIVPLTRAPYDYTGDNPLNRVDPRGLCGAGSVSDVLESFDPISEENCAYQGAEALNDATGVDLPGTLSQPEVVDGGAVVTCLAPVADVVCGGALTFSFIDSSAGVIHEGIETNFCDTSHLAAEEGVNVLLFGFGGLSLKTAGMMAGAPLAAKAAARGGPAAAQGLLDGAESQHE